MYPLFVEQLFRYGVTIVVGVPFGLKWPITFPILTIILFTLRFLYAKNESVENCRNGDIQFRSVFVQSANSSLCVFEIVKPCVRTLHQAI